MTKFITTAIDYPNALPHIGTAFEKIGADVAARYWRLKGEQVYFLGGNDENTVKVVKKAKELNVPVKQYVDELAVSFKEVWKRLNISYDDFIQTSEERHRIGVQQFISAVNEAGFIYKKPFKGLYCEGCEEYKTNGVCENHPTQIVEKEEENYFFRLSAFRQFVLDLIYPTPFVTAFLDIQPDSRYNEIKNFVEKDLQDISISRKNQGWGIPIPWDESQVIYVWFDALLNYLTGIGFGTDWEKFDKWWAADSVESSIIHFIGKDITRFHCVLFPAMIKAYNESPSARKICYPQKVFAHGFIYQRENNKLSKVSKSGVYVSPLDLIDEYGSEAYRYYFLSKCSYHDDGEYNLEHFEQVYKADLSNELGNLVGRVVSLVNKNFDGKLPAKPIDFDSQIWFGPDVLVQYTYLIENYRYKECLELIWNIVKSCNKYVEIKKPWELVKNNPEACFSVLRDLVSGLRIISRLLIPFLPETADKIYNSFISTDGSLTNFAANNLAGFERGVSVNKDFLVDGKYPPLFPKH